MTNVKNKGTTKVAIDGKTFASDAYVPLAFSSSARVAAPLAFAGYGIVAKELGVDDYAGIDQKWKIVVVRRFVPEGDKFSKPEDQRRYGDLRHKAWLARERGARGLVVVDVPAKPEGAPADWRAPDEARLPVLESEGFGDAGVVAVALRRAEGQPLVDELTAKQAVSAELNIALENETKQAFNVIARLPANAPLAEQAAGHDRRRRALRSSRDGWARLACARAPRAARRRRRQRVGDGDRARDRKVAVGDAGVAARRGLHDLLR